MPHPALARTDHRPWPPPNKRWAWRQSWLDLLFAHWPIEAARLRPLLPSALEIDEFDGTAWIGVVPFRMTGLMRRPWPDMPWVSAFCELNVRTYVTHDGKPGVWFFSLDAANPLAVWAAKRWFHLQYHRARMALRHEGDGFHYTSRRVHGDAKFRAWYRPTGDPYEAQPGTLEHWLTERYCLYAASPRGALSCTEVQHAPWPLQAAEAEFTTNTMFAANGVHVDGPPSLLHFARRMDVVVWSPVGVA